MSPDPKAPFSPAALPASTTLLPGLLSTLYRGAFSGASRVTAPGLDARVYFREGQIVHVAMPDRADALGHVLYDMQVIDLGTYRETMRQALAERRRHGEILLGLKLIDERRLFHALSVQLHRKLRRLFATREARWAPAAATHAYGDSEPLRRTLPHPRQVIFLAARLAEPADALAAVEGIRTRRARIPAALQQHVDRYAFGEAAAQTAARLCRGAVTIEELLADEATRGDVVAALCALQLTDLLELLPDEGGRPRDLESLDKVVPRLRKTREFGEAAEAAERQEGWHAGPVTRAMAAGEILRRRVDPVALATADELRRRLDALERQDHFDVLGVARNANDEAVRQAFSALARRFHPDRVTALGLLDLVGEADRYFQHLTEAKATLLDQRARARYQSLLEHARAVGKVNKLLEAERHFLRGDQLLARGDFAAAVEELERAVAENDDDADYRATLAWARYLADKSIDIKRTAFAVMQAKQTLWQLIRRSPESLRAYLYLARVLVETGDTTRAVSCLQRAAQIDPEHVEIKRELHVLERRRIQRTPVTGKSLLDRLRGK